MDQFSIDFASHWDELVGWEKRSAADTTFILEMLRRYECKNVLDVALGTGFHSIKLLEADIPVTSVDVSPAMIEVAASNANRHDVQLDVVCADWVDLSKRLDRKFDCILCLGNSLACEMDAEKRQLSISNWTQVLNDGGIVIVDRRNYEALLNHKYNINSKGQYFGDSVSIKFSEVTDQSTTFSYTFSDGRTFDLNMYPILDMQIREMFHNVGFEVKELYGDRVRDLRDRDVAFYLYVFGKKNG